MLQNSRLASRSSQNIAVIYFDFFLYCFFFSCRKTLEIKEKNGSNFKYKENTSDYVMRGKELQLKVVILKIGRKSRLTYISS